MPPTLNLDELDEKCASLNYVPHKAIEKEVKVAMSNSFGFGWAEFKCVFCRYECVVQLSYYKKQKYKSTQNREFAYANNVFCRFIFFAFKLLS